MKTIKYCIAFLNRTVFSKTSWGVFRDHIGLGGNKKERLIQDPHSLQSFLQTRASHIAQTSLYGYLRTRAGTQYPELFENPDFLVSINIAKWQVWLACLSDLTIYMGGLISQSETISTEAIKKTLILIIDKILDETGIPEEAGEHFTASANKIEKRLAHYNWTGFEDNDSVFTKSPSALLYWAPVSDSFKNRDNEIVQNSVRFRWQEIRRDARRLLRVDSLMKRPETSVSTQTDI